MNKIIKFLMAAILSITCLPVTKNVNALDNGENNEQRRVLVREVYKDFYYKETMISVEGTYTVNPNTGAIIDIDLDVYNVTGVRRMSVEKIYANGNKITIEILFYRLDYDTIEDARILYVINTD